ncbi:KRI1 family protein [Aspergillus puulaauensis]|uniref:KRRI-interacting protein 1 n=1 Tax=Aspergillus puulaauensis TaxID=1220207 RepID=A0A7R7XMZ2_9EURO|nr:KRRI-interacting protein 1 [Aspergillus puulaauensis]BCS23838.1 KRRI-interacting protein 1 [Aspergillus puulaauensis]
MEPPAKKSRKLLEEDSSSDSGDESGGVPLGDSSTGDAFKINEDYARRFEHNKRREERLQLEAKLGKSEDEEESSSEDEDEDDDAELATEAVDTEIMETIKAIRSKDPRVYDQSVTFYQSLDNESAGPQNREDKQKPMTLKDYHKKNLLSGAKLDEDAEDAPKTYAQEQEDLKSAIVKEMHAAGEESGSDDEDDENEGFLVRKSAPEPVSKGEKAPEVDVENADKDPETFLSNFMSSRAWLQTGKSGLQPFESDDEEEDERAEAWEEAYNFRFEDPSKLNNQLVTHARDTTNKQSVRREEKSGRKKLREDARLKKEEEKKQRESEKSRLRKLKMAELQEKVGKIKEVAGFRASELTDEDWVKFLDDSWDDKNWEEEMQKRFDDNYYAENEAGDEKKRPKKPTWDDDIDINDLVPDFEVDENPTVEPSDVEMEDDNEEGGKKKSKTQERRDQKREARKDKLRIEEAVDRNLDLDLALLPNSAKRNDSGFRYRETSPQSFGLSALDILTADDAHLNQFAGLKKYAAFREEEKKQRDQKRLGKKARLRQWRKDTFGNEEGPREFVFGNDKASAPEQADDATDKVDIREGGPRKKRKRSKKH